MKMSTSGIVEEDSSPALQDRRGIVPDPLTDFSVTKRNLPLVL